MRFLFLKKLFSYHFQTSSKGDFSQIDLTTTLFCIFAFLVISLVNFIALEIIRPNLLDTIVSVLMLILTLLLSFLIKTRFKSHRTLISLIILCLQALIIIQYSETYLPRINIEKTLYFPCIEMKILITSLLFFAEKNVIYRIFALIIQMIITAIRTPAYGTPWLYLDYILFAFIFVIIDYDKREYFYKYYEKNRQLKTWSLVLNKVIPIGYMLIGSENDEIKVNKVTLLGYNDYMKKLFEIDEKDEKTPEKLMGIFKMNYLNKNKRTVSCLSIDERRQKSILAFVFEKLELLIKNKQNFEEESIIEEIYQQEVVYKDGRAKAMDITFMNTHINSKPSVLLIFNDISDRVLNCKLTNLDRFKDRFLQSVSHNLKTPLNSITALLSLIHNMVINTEVLNYLNNIRINSDILLFEINNILDFANYRKNSLQAILSEFSINTLLNELCTLFELSIYEKKIKIFKKIKLEGNDILMCSDYNRVKQILFNLMNNSVKFTFEGKIVVSVSKETSLAIPADILKISIKDTGIGISREDQEKLFRLWGSVNDEYLENEVDPQNSRSGAGLGLTISKHLIGLLGPEEKIYCNSVVGKGSIFCFYLYQNLNLTHAFNSNKKKVELVPSFDSSNISINRLTINSQYMLGSIHKGEMGFANFTSYMTHIKSPKQRGSTGIPVRSSLQNGFLKKDGISPSNFSPKSIKPSLPLEIFDENDCIINKVYSDDMRKTIDTQNQFTERSSTLAFKINLINIDRSNQKEAQFDRKHSFLVNQRSILIVDDTPFNLLVLEKFIEEIDPKAVLYKAFNGKDALDKFKEFKEIYKCGFDLIFMDCNMPVMDGYEASMSIKKIIEDENLPFTPILAVTAYSGKAEELKCLKNKMDGYLAKPINKEIFQEFYLKWTFQK